MNSDEEDGFDLLEFNIEEYGKNTIDVLFYLFNDAKSHKALVTGPIRKTAMVSQLDIPFHSIRTALARLCEYKITKLEKFKKGRNGWTRYSIRRSIYDHLLYYEGDAKRASSHFEPQVGEGREFTETFNTEVTLPDNLRALGFGAGAINQLKRVGISNEVIQSSLDGFGYDMEDQDFSNRVRNALPLFMKVMKTEKEYLSSRGYISPEEEVLAQMIELKREKLSRQKRQEDELLDLNFEEWLSTKSDSQINEIVAPTGEFLGQFHRAQVKEFYLSNVLSN